MVTQNRAPLLARAQGWLNHVRGAATSSGGRFGREQIIGTSFFFLAALLFHAPALVSGQVPVEDDIPVFFFPLLVVTHDALRAGHLPLWSPLIFGGYPLFADGEGGMLYPLNLLVLPWFTPEAALVLLSVIHSWLAGSFTYALIRALGVGLAGSLLGGLVYAYSGFAAGQAVHWDVTRSMVWLPLELLLAERMVRASGIARYRRAVLVGAVFGVQALALHIQITLLSALAVGAFVLYRALSPSSIAMGEGQPGWTHPGKFSEAPVHWLRQGVARSLPRLGMASILLGVVGLVGVGLAAVQLFPLAELASATYRSRGLPEALADTNTLWPGSLVTLLLPRLFDLDARDFWGPWVKWETAVYVGMLPLVLAVVGVVIGRGRYPAFFALLAAVSLAAATGRFSPIPLWSLLHGLPGFDALESPGRFALLFSLAVAVAAGGGADALMRRPPSLRLALVVMAAGTGLVSASAVGLQAASGWLQSSAATASALAEAYLRLPGVPSAVDGAPLTPSRVTSLAGAAIDPSNPATAWQLALLASTAIVLGLALAGGSFRRVGGVLAIVVSGADLWVVGATFHPTAAIGELRSPPPPGIAQSVAPPYRVFTEPQAGAKDAPTDPNRLLAAGIEEVAGYSSLEPDRHRSYLSTLLQTDDDLLDLWNVRYVVHRALPVPLLVYKEVAFDSVHALYAGKTGGSREAAFSPAGGPAPTRQIAMVAELRGGAALRDDEEVARLVVQKPDGTSQTLSLRAGADVSDARAGLPGEPAATHRSAEVAFERPWVDPDGSTHRQRLFFTTLRLGEPRNVSRVSIVQTARIGRLLVYGIAAVDEVDIEVAQVRERADRPLIYADHQIRVEGNPEALPRAFLVGEAVVMESATQVLVRMHEGPFDPRRQVILEEESGIGRQGTEGGGQGSGPPTPNPQTPAPAGEARIERYADEQIVVHASAIRSALLVLSNPYFPGWVATVDGAPAPIRRADYLFQAVPVPAGEHTVEFSYEPRPLAIGLVATLISSAVVLVVGAGWRLAPRTWAGLRPRRRWLTWVSRLKRSL